MHAFRVLRSTGKRLQPFRTSQTIAVDSSPARAVLLRGAKPGDGDSWMEDHLSKSSDHHHHARWHRARNRELHGVLGISRGHLEEYQNACSVSFPFCSLLCCPSLRPSATELICCFEPVSSSIFLLLSSRKPKKIPTSSQIMTYENDRQEFVHVGRRESPSL